MLLATQIGFKTSFLGEANESEPRVCGFLPSKVQRTMFDVRYLTPTPIFDLPPFPPRSALLQLAFFTAPRSGDRSSSIFKLPARYLRPPPIPPHS